MIVNIRSGRSFKHAGLYYLHDKLSEADRKAGREHPQTSERVAWTATRNCLNDDPDLALREMMATFYEQNDLKRAAGLSTAGRKCQEPLKTISLSWHPDQRPDRQAMEDAADNYLKQMGWAGHQAVIVAHKDTAHPHVHIMLSRIDPETGRTLNDWQEHRRTSQWALQFEKEHGRVWCEARQEKYEQDLRIDARGADHDRAVALREEMKPALADEQRRREDSERSAPTLSEQQKAERIQWFEDGKQEFRKLRQEVFREVRDEFKPVWREHFEWAAEREAEAKAASANAVTRALYFARTGDLEAAQAALFDRDAVLKAAHAEIADDKAAIKAEQARVTKELQNQALDELRAERDALYRALLDRQREERAAERIGAVTEGRATFANEARPEAPANDNRMPDRTIEVRHDVPFVVFRDEVAAALRENASVEPALPREDVVPMPVPDAGRIGDGTDAAAGAIGAAANYIADQLGELFAPTPPEVREARAKAEAVRASDKPVVEQKDQNPYARHIEAAIRKADAEHEQKRDRDYWDDRERERDR